MMTPEEQHLALCEWYGKYPHSMAMIKHWEIAGLKQTPIFELTLDWLHECLMKLPEERVFPGYYDNLELITDHSTIGMMRPTKDQVREALCRTLWPERFE